jgi:glutamate carboxypeptidase
VVSRNGKIGARLDAVGKDEHVGAKGLEKASAVLELAHRTIALEGMNGTLPGVRVNVGTVEGGLGPATIPARAHALVDVRWEEQGVREELGRALEEATAGELLPGCRSQLTILNERSAWPLTPGTQRLADLVKEVGAALGWDIDQEHRLGTSDSNFFGCAGVPTVDGLGPVCRGYHTPQELVYISSIGERTELLAGVLAALGRAIPAGEWPPEGLHG